MKLNSHITYSAKSQGGKRIYKRIKHHNILSLINLVLKLVHTFSINARVCFFFVYVSLAPSPPGPLPPLRGTSIVFRGADIDDVVTLPSVPLNSIGWYFLSFRSTCGSVRSWGRVDDSLSSHDEEGEEE